MLIFEKRADLLLNKVDDLVKEIEQLRSKNNEYARLLALKDNDVDKVRKELSQEVEAVKKELAQELSANKELKETISAHSGEIKNLKAQLAAKEKEIAALTSDISAKQRSAASELTAKEKVIEEKTSALACLEKAYNAIKEENVKNKNELAAIQKKLDTREEELRVLKNQLGKQKDAFTAVLDEKNKVLNGKDLQLSDFDRQNRQYKREIASYLSTIEKLKEKLQANQQQIEDLQRKLVAKGKPSEFYRQKDETKSLSGPSEIAALQEKLSLQRSTIENLEKRLAEKEQTKDSVGDGVQSAGAIQLQKELEIKNAELKQVNAKLASRDEELFALQKKLLSIQQELAAIKAEKGSKISDVSKKDEQIAKLNSQLNAMQERFEKAVVDYKRKIERLEGELVSAKKAIPQQPQESSASAASANKLAPRAAETVSEDVCKKEFSEKEKELNFLHTRLQEARLAQQELNIALKQQKEDYEKRLAELQNQLETQRQSQQLTANVVEEDSSAGVKVQNREFVRVSDALKNIFRDEIANQRMRLTQTNDSLVISLLADSLFNSGSDEIRLSNIPILSAIGKVLNNEAQGFQIIVEGHTDNQPIRYSQWKSNWELSSARALSVLHYFINECGISSSRLSLCGFGEFKPVASNDTEAGRQSNRRVEIILIPQNTSSLSVNTK